MGLADILQQNRTQGLLVLQRQEVMVTGLAGGRASPAAPSTGTAALALCSGAAGPTHLLTLVVTDGKLIQDKVPALPALPLEKRGGNCSALGSGALPVLERPQNIPSQGWGTGSPTARGTGDPALTTFPCFTQ